MDFVNTLVRNAAQWGGAFLVTKGYFGDSDVEVFVGVVTGLVALGWSVYNHFKNKKAVADAKAANA